ncbi:MAG: DUF1080 domain-containing protein [Acidobacteria bacterium]|nr:DUF1080 domain-containing protein [Acidobacteriota bacterium]
MIRTTALLLASLALAAANKPLFNGKDLAGWKQVGWPGFGVENGAMKTSGGMGLLFYELEAFENATVKIVFKTQGERGNSGIYIRMPEKPSDAWYGVHNGYEVQIDSSGDDWHCTGAIYSISKVSARNQKPVGEWNTLEIELKGATTRVRLNGKLVNEYTEGQAVPERKQWYEPIRGPRANKGYIGIQNHDAASIVLFKEISVKK